MYQSSFVRELYVTPLYLKRMLQKFPDVVYGVQAGSNKENNQRAKPLDPCVEF